VYGWVWKAGVTLVLLRLVVKAGRVKAGQGWAGQLGTAVQGKGRRRRREGSAVGRAAGQEEALLG